MGAVEVEDDEEDVEPDVLVLFDEEEVDVEDDVDGCDEYDDELEDPPDDPELDEVFL